MQDQRIADEEPEETAAWSSADPSSPGRARRSDRPAVVDEWLRRQVRRLLDQVGAVPSPAFLRRERSASSNAPRRIGAERPVDRTVQGIAAIILFLLVLCLALTTWQWRAARTAEAVALAQSQRTSATGDFLSDVLRIAARSSSDDAAQRSHMKQVLDGATPRIVNQFADDPRGQGELLGLVASMYGEIGEFDSRRALLALQRIQLRRLYGESHVILIRSLLDEAQTELMRGDFESASARLYEADPLITQARRDDDALRARWWMLRSDAQPGTTAETEALDRAIAVLERQRPVDARLGEALSRKAWRVLPEQPELAEALFERVVTLSGESAARRRDALVGLAQAREGQGEYEIALQARDEARSFGERRPVDDARFAWALHREGLRERAMAEFEALAHRRVLGAGPGGVGDAAAGVYYAQCLAVEGRPMQAIPLLETAAARPEMDLAAAARALLALGDAYDRAGLWWKARDTISSSLDQRLSRQPQGSAGVTEARERWGRFLLGRGDLDGAQAQFDLVLDQDGGRNVERVVLAYGGLARVALERHDWDAALTASTHAVVGFENLVGARDVRSGPYLWLIHAEALRNVDDYASARIWATRALDASRRYDAPDAASIRDAQAVIARLEG